MSTENTAKARGSIVKVPDNGPGLLFINGQQKAFTMEGVWKSPTAPAPNMIVDVEIDPGGAVTAITAVDPHQVSKERLNQLGGVAQEQGKQAAELAKKGIGALAARMGAVALGATVVLWIAWFFLPTVSISMGLGGSTSLTFWNLLGVDMSDPSTLVTASHGLLAFLGLVAIVLPFAAPFIRDPRAKFLNVAPLAYIVLMGLKFEWDIHQATSQAQQAVKGMDPQMAQLASQMAQAAAKEMSNAVSFSIGIYVLVIAAVVLALPALKSLRPAPARA